METQEILDQFPELRAIIDPGAVTVLPTNRIRLLSVEAFRALCSLPLDIAIPPAARDAFVMKARESNVRVKIDTATGKIKVKILTI